MANHTLDYIWVTADNIHNGHQFLKEKTYIKISNSGQILDISQRQPTHESVKYYEDIISPGFVNSHCHLELSHQKDKIERGTGLVQFLLNVMKPQENSISNLIIDEVIESSYKRGIVGYGDISNTTNSLESKKKSRLHFHTFIEALGKIPERADGSYAHFSSILKSFKEDNHVNHQSSLTIHAPYSISNQLAHLVNEHEKSSTLSIHSQESIAETELFINRTGEFLDFYNQMNIPIEFTDIADGNSLDWLLRQVDREHRLILVHNTFSQKEDWKKIASRPKTYICLCPKANLYIENTLPPIDQMADVIDNICIGTDSLASNDSIDICSEMKTILDHFPQIGVEKIISWATSRGAAALGWKNLGEIKVGNTCHLVNISKDLTRSQLIV